VTDRQSGYERPKLLILGSFAELTLVDKKQGLSDGLYLLTVGPLTNSSA
jgi:hypothetical protein